MDDLFAEVDRICADDDYKIIKAPFPYPGGKSRSVKHILPHLPYRNTYVEPFGGSGAILLARQPSKIEVFNDRYAGVTDFYRCIRNPVWLDSLINWLDNSVQSREEFLYCRDTWKDCEEVSERAARWYFMTMYSFGALGRNFGRATTGITTTAGVVNKKLKYFHEIHKRFVNVIVENRPALTLLHEFDSPDTVFYLDPPYLTAHTGTYKYEMSIDDHKELIETIFTLEGFVAVSGFDTPLYSNQDWDYVTDWETFCSISPRAFTKSNNKEDISGVDKRVKQKEMLWIKE